MKSQFLVLFLFLSITNLFAQSSTPLWLIKRPVSDEFFYGIGRGSTAEDAELAGKREILLQLKSQVNGVIRVQDVSKGVREPISEKIDSFFDSTELRSAEVEERVKFNGSHFALVKYPENCGLLMTRSVIKRYENEHNVNPDTVISQLDNGVMIRAARIERVLNDVTSGDYGTDISVSMDNNSLVIQIFNFPPFGTVLTESQQQSFEALSAKLFDELKSMDYGDVAVEGHANPTETIGESVELERISQSRAETMAAFLRREGITINTVKGFSDERLLGDHDTEQGRGFNRRVEITIEIKQ